MKWLVACLCVFGTGCFFTSFHSPRANKSGEVTGGLHGVGVAVDESTEGIGTVAGTIRVGTEVGEFGGTISGFNIEGSFKVPLTSRDGSTHISLLAGIADYMFIFPEANFGILAGQDLGPLTPYVGYRQHLFTAGLAVGHYVGGLEIRLSEDIALMAEANYNDLFSGASDGDDDDLFDVFNVAVFSVGIVFGPHGRGPEEAPQQNVIGPPGGL
jgi:hypothetical protein